MPALRSSRMLLIAVLGLGGCEDIVIRPAKPPDLLDEWRASAVSGGELSARTRQTLRRYDLEHIYRRSPEQAAKRLHSEALADPQPDLLFALAEVYYLRGRQAEKWSCRDAIGYHYLAAGYAYHYLFTTADRDASGEARPLSPRDAFDPRFRLACELYNAGLAKCIRAAQKSGRLDPCSQMRLPVGDGTAFVLSVDHKGFDWKPEEFGSLRFCSDFEVVGLANQYHAYGLGVPLIGTRAVPRNSPEGKYYPDEVFFPVTAFLRYEGTLADLGARRVGRLELVNPLTQRMVADRGRSIPIETDLTTPTAYMLAHSDLRGLEYTGFLHADRLQGKTGIQMFQQYQPGKIPIVMVHGLLSSPLTWTPMYNDLMADPAIRDRFQFWAYFYPTGEPYLVTAADLRKQLKQMRTDLDPQGKDAALDQMVFLGHSMGGLISHLLTVDSGNDFWSKISDRPFDSLPLSPDAREALRPVFFFERQQYIRRVVFLGTPHHGSGISPSILGRAAASLVEMPKAFLTEATDLIQADPDLPPELRKGHILTSVDMLNPEDRTLELLAGKPRPDPVRYHSVIGLVSRSQLGIEGLLPGLGVPEQGDGVVPYRSAHLDGVDSEVTVPAEHMHVHHHPLAVREVRRILLEHAKSLETIKLVSDEAAVAAPTQGKPEGAAGDATPHLYPQENPPTIHPKADQPYHQ
jgi:pimeloyl-ACP methyl ester carboxylesterase